jgi:hypothetical protein
VLVRKAFNPIKEYLENNIWTKYNPGKSKQDGLSRIFIAILDGTALQFIQDPEELNDHRLWSKSLNHEIRAKLI